MGFRAVCALLEVGQAHYRTHELLAATWHPGDERHLLALASGPALPNFASWSVLRGLGCADTPVVRAYLYAGEPVREVQLTQTVPINPTDGTVAASPPPINDARVALVRNGVRYALTRAPGDSGYYQYPGTDLVVREGDSWTLEATVGTRALSARTSRKVTLRTICAA